MKNLHFAIICSYNCVKYFNELEELTEEQRDLVLNFADRRCYDYLIDSVYEIVHTK